MPVKLRPEIDSKPVTLKLQSGWFALVPAMFIDLADERKEPYNLTAGIVNADFDPITTSRSNCPVCSIA